MTTLYQLLNDDHIVCNSCIHKKVNEYGFEYCRMGMVKNLERKKCSELIRKSELVDNEASRCYPMMFDYIYEKLRLSDEKHEIFYQKYCKKCKNKTGRNWCRRFARLTSEISR